MDATAALAIIGLAVSIAAGLMFGTAALAKLRHRALLPGVVANYRLLPAVFVAPAAFALPWVEGALAIVLMSGVRPWPQWWAAALLTVFAAAMAVNIRRGRTQIDCGCGLSALRQPLDRTAVVRNLMLSAALLAASVAGDAPGAAGVAAAAVAGAALFLFYLIFNAIGALSRTSPAAMGR